MFLCRVFFAIASSRTKATGRKRSKNLPCTWTRSQTRKKGTKKEGEKREKSTMRPEAEEPPETG